MSRTKKPVHLLLYSWKYTISNGAKYFYDSLQAIGCLTFRDINGEKFNSSYLAVFRVYCCTSIECCGILHDFPFCFISHNRTSHSRMYVLTPFTNTMSELSWCDVSPRMTHSHAQANSWCFSHWLMGERVRLVLRLEETKAEEELPV